MRRVEIRGRGERDGRPYRLNEYAGDNAMISSMSGERATQARERLLREANRALSRWRELFPHDDIFVIEVGEREKWR